MSPSPLRSMALCVAALWLSACGAQTASPDGTPTLSPTPAVSVPPRALTDTAKSVDGGGVTVRVTPLSLAPGAPLAFDVVLDTHSVDLKDELRKVAVLRDEQGKEYEPVAWEGAAPGGHHRQGTLTFPVVSGAPKALTLVLRGVGGVPERTFTWDLAR